jgi:hypothetical protein
MAKYRVTVEWTTRLSQEVEAASVQAAEELADEMYQEFLKGENAHLAGTQQRRSIELVSNAEPRRWAPVDA